MIIDAKGLIVGRIATIAAKKALLGEEVQIVNAEQAVVSGRREFILQKIHHAKFKRGTYAKGPFISKMPHFLLRRMIRGMLPWEKAKGRAAYARIKCYVGTPKAVEGKAETIPSANYKKMPHRKIITIQEISNYLGGKP